MSSSFPIGGAVTGIVLSLALGAGCYYASDAGTTGDTPPVTSTEFPCEAAAVLSTCWSCHTTPPRGGATFALDHLADLQAVSTVAPTMTVGERSLVRLRDSADPMPPRGYPRPSDADIAMFEAWLGDGMPAGTCQGTDPNQPAPVICTSGTNGTSQESPNMNPGRACRECHLREEPEKAYYFMGTAYPTLHERNQCNSTGTAGARVEILDASGAVRITMSVLASGNFYRQQISAGITLPYTARVVSAAGTTIEMTTKQTNGDCNSCHTEQGANGALGRVLIPTP